MEKLDLENFPTSESARKMLSYVSDGFYDESYVGKWLFQVMGMEYDKALEIVEDLPAQFFPETATWGLMFHEIKWGLPVRPNLSFEERRRLIFQKRDYRAPMTPYRMESYLKNATGFDVFVADCHDPGPYNFNPAHPNIFKVFFSGEGTLDSKTVHGMIVKLKQAHTTYTVNDHTSFVFDNSGTEKMFLRNVRIAVRVPFWNMKMLDGSWNLDGDSMLDAVRIPIERNARLVVKMQMAAIEEDMGGSVDIRKDLWHLDGTVLMNGTRKLDADRKEEVL